MLSLDPVNLICIVVNLIVLYILMKKFVFGRVLAIIDARQKLIEDEKAGAKAVREEAERLKKESEKALADVRTSSDQLVNDARERAREERDRILTHASEEVEAMKADARKSIEQERAKVMDEAHAHVVELAMEAAGKILSTQVSPVSEDALFDSFIKEAGDGNETGRE